VTSAWVAYAGGVAFVAFGVLIIRFGDRQVGDKGREGIITRMLAMPAWNAKVLKWVIGLLCIWFGIAVVFTRGNL
jgi:hypothetical protein